MWTHTTETVATSSGELVAANSHRKTLRLQNIDSTNPVYINLAGGAAVDEEGIRIAAGEILDLVDQRGTGSTGAINAIAISSAVTVLVSELADE